MIDRVVAVVRSDPAVIGPGALGLTCRPGLRPPPARQPDGGDLIRACRPDSSQCCPPGRRACHPPPGQGKETAIPSIPHPVAPQLTIGVDTHLELHVAHANDQLGRPLATLQIPTTPAGYQQLLAWAHGLGCRSPGGGGHRQLRRCPRPLPGRQRPSRGRGQPTRPGDPTAEGQVRPPGRPGRRPGRPGRTGQGVPKAGWARWR
jgi:hypothetical protein